MKEPLKELDGVSRRAADLDSLPIHSKDLGFAVGWFYALSVYIVRVVAVTFFSARFFWLERLPKKGAMVLAPNHLSFLDPALVGMCPLRQSCYLARETLFKVPILGWMIRRYQTFPIPRENTAPKRALEVCVKILEKGRALILFPEGTRSKTGQMQPLKRGIVLLARRTSAPVVPILVEGSFHAWPKGRRLPRPHPVKIFFGNPIYFQAGESSDEFVDRLTQCYFTLAEEAEEAGLSSAAKALTNAFLSEKPPSPNPSEERLPLLKAAAGT